MSKLTRLLVLVLSLAVLSFVSLACCNLTKGEPTIESAVTCKDITDDYKPVNETSTYAPEDTFYCSVKASNLKQGQTMTWKWYYGDEFLYEQPLTLDKSGSGYVAAYLSSDQPWPQGDYKVEIFLDDVLAQTVTFSVQ
ncbi:MAG: hypothetical protein DRI52_01930 [Chloroflexi bacterium]|nr:hypothetical protein [Anaerolineae bacterium]RLC73402.1 MAG: hypothetical protein DRI52_01930 [Chloroflexota bacterium]